jgi:Na+-transporting methylmalonyl-CoA/oxaloacetate decarboxylase gamma subunit
MGAIAATGNGYVAAAYLVFLFLVLSYLAIMATKLSRIEREVVEISEIVESRSEAASSNRAKEPVA